MPLVPETVDAAIISALGSTVTYTPFGGSATPIQGMFQNPDVIPETNVIDFLTQGPMVSVLAVDAPSPSSKDLFTVSGQNYTVKDYEIDDGGLVYFQLEETP